MSGNMGYKIALADNDKVCKVTLRCKSNVQARFILFIYLASHSLILLLQ